MAKDINGAIGNLAAIAKNSVEKIDVEVAKKKMVQASKKISEKKEINRRESSTENLVSAFAIVLSSGSAKFSATSARAQRREKEPNL